MGGDLLPALALLPVAILVLAALPFLTLELAADSPLLDGAEGLIVDCLFSTESASLVFFSLLRPEPF